MLLGDKSHDTILRPLDSRAGEQEPVRDEPFRLVAEEARNRLARFHTPLSPRTMSRRTRKPTLRAIEAAQTAIHLRSAPAVEQARSASSTPRQGSPASSVASAGPSAAPVKRNGRAVNARGAQAVARELARNQASVPGLGEDEDEDGAAFEDDSQQEQQQDMTLCASSPAPLGPLSCARRLC